MTYKIKNSFDIIRAEDRLKADTILYLQNEIQRRRKPAVRFAAVFASFAVVFLIGIFAGALYVSPSAYIAVDVNPSVELTINRFDRVVGIHAYNEDGKNVLSGLDIKHKSYTDALDILLEAMNQKGYIKNNGLMSVTLQTKNPGKEKALLSNTQAGITGIMATHHNTMTVDIFPVDAATRNKAHEHNITPAKYLAISELMQVDPNASIESCRGHSISEIRQQTQDCHSRDNETGHHMNGNSHNGHHG